MKVFLLQLKWIRMIPARRHSSAHGITPSIAILDYIMAAHQEKGHVNIPTSIHLLGPLRNSAVEKHDIAEKMGHKSKTVLYILRNILH